ncbi:MAG: hypothetical protein LUD51_06545 [Clostridia bacterium]|nr:hypothetical protein [Clostridia bacterium]
MKHRGRVLLICLLVFVVLACLAVFVALYFTIWKVELEITAVQTDEDAQTITVGWDTSRQVDKVVIEVSHDGDDVQSVTLSNMNQIRKGEYEVDAFYGRQTVKVSTSKGIYTATETTEVELYADEYVIAPLTSTMPVTLFSLELEEITDGYTIPTFVWLKRASAWNYKAMPENVYTMPVGSATELTKETDEKTIYAKTSEWIRELYEINPDSYFHLYYCDYFAYGWMDATIASGIPAENYDVTLLSDGTASFEAFNRHFNNADSALNAAEYEKMKGEYETLKTQVAAGGSYTRNSKYVIDAGDLKEYAYVMAKEEPNVTWWLTRISGTLATDNDEMYAEVEALVDTSIFVKDLNTLLSALDESQQASLKALYNFSDEMFTEAAEEGKKIMLILGTWDVNEDCFDDYVKAVMAYCGDDYVYYYKGHPKNPTYTVSGKLEHLEELGLTDIDSTIPAELILFFNPGVYVSGYQSTTFVSVDPEYAAFVFNCRMADFDESLGYKDSMDGFISPVSSGDADYGCLVTDSSSYVLEFSSGTEIAIYSAKTGVLTYYTLQTDGTYSLDTEESVSGTEEGSYPADEDGLRADTSCEE